jgi:hypothetical protein
MPLSDISIAIELSQASGIPLHFFGPQPAYRVRSAQQELSVEFPSSYLKFVSAYGCGTVGGEEFYGVFSDDLKLPSTPNVVWLTISARNSGRLPHELILVGDVGDGAEYVIDTSKRGADGECPVLEWWSGSDEEDQCREPIAADFGAFFLQMTREAIERYQRRESKNKTDIGD